MRSELRLRKEDEFKVKHKVIGMNQDVSFVTLKPSDNVSIQTLEQRTKEWLRLSQEHVSYVIKYHWVIEIGNQITSTRYLSSLGGVSTMDYHVHLVVNIPPCQIPSLQQIWSSLNPSDGKYNRKRLFNMIPFRDDHSGYMAKQADHFGGKLIEFSNTKRVLKPVNSGHKSELKTPTFPRPKLPVRGGEGRALNHESVSRSRKGDLQKDGVSRIKPIGNFFLKILEIFHSQNLFILKEHIRLCRIRLNMLMKRMIRSTGMHIRSPT